MLSFEYPRAMSETMNAVFGEAVIEEAIRLAEPSRANRTFARIQSVRVGGLPSPDTLPAMYQRDVGEIGFTALATIYHGYLPRTMSHNFTGPEGYIQYQVYPQTENSYLHTSFSDGTAIMTAKKPGTERRTQFLTWEGSFRESYQRHLDACSAKCEGTLVRPLRRETVEDVLPLWRFAFLALWEPKLAATSLLVSLLIVVMHMFMIGVVIYLAVDVMFQ